MQAGKHTLGETVGRRMEGNIMWEWDMTRDGRATARKCNVGVEANRAVVASTQCPRSILHP